MLILKKFDICVCYLPLANTLMSIGPVVYPYCFAVAKAKTTQRWTFSRTQAVGTLFMYYRLLKCRWTHKKKSSSIYKLQFSCHFMFTVTSETEKCQWDKTVLHEVSQWETHWCAKNILLYCHSGHMSLLFWSFINVLLQLAFYWPHAKW